MKPDDARSVASRRPATRARAIERLGQLLAYNVTPPRVPFVICGLAHVEAWRDFVMPLALVRGDYELGPADAMRVFTCAGAAAEAAAYIAPRLL